MILRSDTKDALKVEQICITEIINSLEKMRKFYWEPKDGDKVAECQALNAMTRIISYIIEFYENGQKKWKEAK